MPSSISSRTERGMPDSELSSGSVTPKRWR
nr:MAG TPA: hypothetical protein [Caudoviricetes sp.]DAJ29139.1 MAG TPA: cytochrome oxidase subunit [Caudoviricetes sp.]